MIGLRTLSKCVHPAKWRAVNMSIALLSTISEMSAPAANAFSFPVTTIAPMASSASKPASASPSSSISTRLSAFSTLGRSSTTRPTAPLVSVRMQV